MPSTKNKRGDLSTTGDQILLNTGKTISKTVELLVTQPAADIILTLPGTADTLVGKVTLDTGANGLRNKELHSDTVAFVHNGGIFDQKLKFSLGALSGTTTITPPDVTSDTMAVLGLAQGFTATQSFPSTDGVQFNGISPFLENAGSLQLQNINTIDGTTEDTIESAIDALPNLATIQSYAFTLGGNVSTGGTVTTSNNFTTAVNDITLNAHPDGSDVTLPENGLIGSSSDFKLIDTGADHFLTFEVGEDLPADNTLQFVVGPDAAVRVLTLNKDLSILSNAVTFDAFAGAAIATLPSGSYTLTKNDSDTINDMTLTSTASIEMDDGSTIDTETNTVSTAVLNIGTVKADGINIGRSGKTTTIKGDLYVEGTTTTVDTEHVQVGDALIDVNFGGDKITATGSGIQVDSSDDGLPFSPAPSLKYNDALQSGWEITKGDGTAKEVVDVSSTQSQSNKSFDNTNDISVTDSNLTLEGATANATFNADLLTANRAFTLPDEDQKIVGETHPATLTDKTLGEDTSYNFADVAVDGFGDIDTNSHAATVYRITSASADLTTLSNPGAGNVLVLENKTGSTLNVINNSGAGGFLTGTGGDIVLQDDSSITVIYNTADGRWSVVGGTGAGSGQGEINYVTQYNAEAGDSLWLTYDDGAFAVPPGNFNQPATNITFGASTTEVLRGAKSFELAKSATDAQGEGVFTDIDFDPADTNKLCKLSFDYKFTGTYDGSEEVRVYIWDEDLGSLISPAISVIPANTNDGVTLNTTFASTSSTNYKVFFHVSKVGTSAWNLYLDNIIVGPGQVWHGTAETDWEDFVPDFRQDSSTGTVVNVTPGYATKWKRSGGSLKIQGRVRFDTIPAFVVVMNMPIPGISVTTTGFSDQNFGQWGTFNDQDHGYISIGGAGKDSFRFNMQTNSGSYVKYNNLASTNTTLSFSLEVPIAEWQGSGNFGNNYVEYPYSSGTSTGGNDLSDFAFGVNGANIVAISLADTDVNKRIQTVRNITATDEIKLEVLTAGDSAWQDAERLFPYMTDGTKKYGIRWEQESDNEINVYFGGDGANPNEAWSTYTSYKWRMKVHSAGVPVGFGFASETSEGIVSTDAQTFGGEKTFADNVTVNGNVTLNEPTGGPDLYLSGTGSTGDAFVGNIHGYGTDGANDLANITFRSAGANNRGRLIFRTNSDGVVSDKLTIDHDGSSTFTGPITAGSKISSSDGIYASLGAGDPMPIFTPTPENAMWLVSAAARSGGFSNINASAFVYRDFQIGATSATMFVTQFSSSGGLVIEDDGTGSVQARRTDVGGTRNMHYTVLRIR